MARGFSPPAPPGQSPAAAPGPLAYLSHELRTPLNAILGFAEAMRERAFGPLSDRYAEHAALIHDAGRHMLALVDAMTERAQPDAGDRAPPSDRFDPAALVLEIAGMTSGEAKRAGVTVRVAPTPDIGEAVAVRAAIAQILINLVDNALKFAPAGGEVVIALCAEGGELLIRVEDSGPGPARTAAPDWREGKGEGLGLAIARAACALHAGSLVLEDRPEGGALALARLPILAGG